MLMELSQILSEGGGPTVASEQLEALRRDNPLLVYNPGWDMRRLWIDSFAGDRAQVHDHRLRQDQRRRRRVPAPAEHLRGLRQGDAAVDQRRRPIRRQALPIVRFTLTCEVKY